MTHTAFDAFLQDLLERMVFDDERPATIQKMLDILRGWTFTQNRMAVLGEPYTALGDYLLHYALQRDGVTDSDRLRDAIEIAIACVETYLTERPHDITGPLSTRPTDADDVSPEAG